MVCDFGLGRLAGHTGKADESSYSLLLSLQGEKKKEYKKCQKENVEQEKDDIDR